MDNNAAGGRVNASSSTSSSDDHLSRPISRRHLHDELLVRLRDYIIGGVLPPGAKIPEKELCERFGVSRTPLREALKVLAYEGLVVLNHNRGSTVSPLTLDDLAQTFPIFAKMEGLAGELACEKLSTDEIAEIRRLHDEMVAHYQRRDYRSHLIANAQIHSAIHLGSKNQSLIQLLDRLSSRVARARSGLVLSEAQWANAIAEHEAVIAALEARDGPLAATLLRRHVEGIFDSIKEALTDPDSKASLNIPFSVEESGSTPL